VLSFTPHFVDDAQSGEENLLSANQMRLSCCVYLDIHTLNILQALHKRSSHEEGKCEKKLGKSTLIGFNSDCFVNLVII
jgi:hypothetical protein